jgi:hypothetical protein
LILPQGHFEQILELGYGGRGAGKGVSHGSEREEATFHRPASPQFRVFFRKFSPGRSREAFVLLAQTGSRSIAKPTVVPHFPGIF